MGFFRKYFEQRKRKKQEAIEKRIAFSRDIPASTLALEALFSDINVYIDPYHVAQWQDQWSGLIIRAASYQQRPKKKTPLETETINKIIDYNEIVSTIDERVKSHNDGYIALRIDNLKNLIGPIEGRSLDEQQLACILKETRNHLVVAGAGTGKTITVIAKIKFLLKANKYKPGEILVLSFTHASATEMCQRIRKETGESIAAMTFHKLGMTIITAVNGVKPNITQISLSVFIRQSLNELMKDPLYLKKFITYLYFHRTKQKSEFEFTTQTEYDDYLELNQPITMKNEIVKSYGEMDIANYLYKNGINYQYEAPYKINTATQEYARYVPDFYLPDEDIYIEYFGINRNGQVPVYFTGKNNKTPSETYKESMTWKRMLHAGNNTVMLELYGYDMLEGQLLQSLEEKLKAENVSFNPKSDSELWDEIKNTHKSIFESLGKIFETVINLVKINDYPFEKVYELNKVHKGNQYQNNRSVIELIEPIFNRYAAQLNKNHEIDFNDMINMASKYVADGKYQHAYGYVIVDEYQDISKARYNLLKCMREKNDYALFCVGDDWQSIYGFAGSDLNYILDFERYWGVSEKSKIETTYRFSQSLIQVSSEFVMKNPKQIKKKLRSANESGVMSIKATNRANEFSLGLIEGYTAKNTVTFMEGTITDLPQNSSVFFIGRYNNDVRLFENSPFKCHYENTTGKTMVQYTKRSDLKIEFLSAHKSKGLQADYVFIINNKEKSYGFPSKIQNDEVVQLLLEEADDYQYSEERRLFYVAITRTRKKAWLLVQKDNKSVFVQELFSGFAKELMAERYTCPQCGGRIFKKKGAYGEFFGCSNYHKGCTYTKKIAVKKPV